MLGYLVSWLVFILVQRLSGTGKATVASYVVWGVYELTTRL